eukprot:COSAG05_NODE_8001_length_747_cov_0.918210_1_plen_220_part_10
MYGYAHHSSRPAGSSTGPQRIRQQRRPYLDRTRIGVLMMRFARPSPRSWKLPCFHPAAQQQAAAALRMPAPAVATALLPPAAAAAHSSNTSGSLARGLVTLSACWPAGRLDRFRGARRTDCSRRMFSSQWQQAKSETFPVILFSLLGLGVVGFYKEQEEPPTEIRTGPLEVLDSDATRRDIAVEIKNLRAGDKLGYRRVLTGEHVMHTAYSKNVPQRFKC